MGDSANSYYNILSRNGLQKEIMFWYKRNRESEYWIRALYIDTVKCKNSEQLFRI